MATTEYAATDLGQELVLQFLDSGRRADPYPLYARVRAEDPVHHSPLGIWVLTRHAEVHALLRDPRLSSDEHHSNLSFSSNLPTPFQRMADKLMLFRDPPDHTRLRGLVNKAFTPRAVESMRPRIQEIVDRLLDAVVANGEMDLISDFAYPLPVTVICEMLGVPVADRSVFHGWARDLANRFDISPGRTSEVEERGNVATESFQDYFSRLIELRRRNLGDDVLSALIAAEEEGDRLDADEVMVTAALLLMAGHETTANLIGNGTLALLRHPEEMERLRRDPTLIRNAIEELLRYDSPVQMTQRIPLEDVAVGDVTITKGDPMALVLGAANRDPERFPDPDRLDVGRADIQHLSFGGGIHYCLGAALARVEAHVAFAALADRLPRLELAIDEPEWRTTFVLRGLTALPVRWAA